MLLKLTPIVLLLRPLPFSRCTFVPVPRTKEDFDAQRRDRLLSKYKSGDTAFVLRHYNDDFMHSHGGLPHVQLLKHVSNMDTFAQLVDQTDPGVLATATDFPHEKVAVIEPIIKAYQEATTAADRRNVNEFVEELVIRGPLNAAGRLKFLREHIENIADDILSCFPPALIKKLMVGTKHLDRAVQNNFLQWIDDLPYFTEIEVYPETLIDAIKALCSEARPSMLLIERLVEDAPSTVLEELKSVPLVAQMAADLLVKHKTLQILSEGLIYSANYKMSTTKDIEALLKLRPSFGILAEYFKNNFCDSKGIMHSLLDAATPTQLHRLSRMNLDQFVYSSTRAVLQERLPGLHEGMHLYSYALPRAPSAVVDHINAFLGTDTVTTQKLKSFYGATNPKSAGSGKEEALIKLVCSKATDEEIIAFLEKNGQLQNCRMFIVYANEVGPELSVAILAAFVTAHKGITQFSSAMIVLLPEIRSPMLVYILSQQSVQYKDIAHWTNFLRKTEMPVLFLHWPVSFSVYPWLLFEYRIQEIMFERAKEFFKVAEAGNLKAVKKAFDCCEPYLHASIIKKACELTKGHPGCREYLERHTVYRSGDYLLGAYRLLSLSKENNPDAEQIQAILRNASIAEQHMLLMGLFELIDIKVFNVVLPKFAWSSFTKKAIQWFDLKAVEVFALRCRCLGLAARHEFMKTLMELRPDLKLIDVSSKVTFPKPMWGLTVKNIMRRFNYKSAKVFNLRCHRFRQTAKHKLRKALMKHRFDLQSLNAPIGDQGDNNLPAHAASFEVVEE